MKVEMPVMNKEVTNGAKSEFVKYWRHILEHYGTPFGQYCIKFLYAVYTNFTFSNVVLFLIKCVPTVVFMHGIIKKIYISSQERIKWKQAELEDLQLQIQVAKTKLIMRDAEFAERGELLRRKVENLHRIRARIREMTNDDGLRNAINGNALWDDNAFFYSNNTSEEDSSESKYVMEFLRELKYDQVEIPELDPGMLSCGEPSRDSATAENSVYSSAADGDGKQDCQVKIIKVTNVYRVAYLRHFIKQKRLRRLNRQALLRKKMDCIKKLLEDWQKTLNMVINTKICLLNGPPQAELASQEAMGDCSKPPYNNSSDSDSDFINSTDNFHDNYSLSWSQNQYLPVSGYSNYDEFNGDTAVSREYYVGDFDKCKCHEEQEDYNKGVLYVVPEETSSQLEIREVQSDVDESNM